MAVSENRSTLPRRKALAAIGAAAVAASGVSVVVASDHAGVVDSNLDAALMGLWRLWKDASERMTAICREQDRFGFIGGVDRANDPVAQAGYDECERRLDRVIGEMNEIERAIVGTRAQSMTGIAVKLAIWRNGQFIDLSDEDFLTRAVDSAYRDVLAVTGHEYAIEAIRAS